MKPRALLGWVLLASLCLGGCRAVPPAAPPTAVVSQEQALARLDARQRAIQGFQGKGRITYLSPDQNYSGTLMLTGSMPATLKTVILDFLGRTILSFTTDGAEVQVFSPKEGKLFSGPATARNLAAFIPPAVALPQALRLLAGALPLSQGPPDRFTYDASQDRYLLEWGHAGALQERLWLTGQGLYPVREEWYGGAPEPRFTADLADFGALAPDFPEKITIKSTRPQLELRLAYRELRLNPPLNPGDLKLQAPAGTAVVPLP